MFRPNIKNRLARYVHPVKSGQFPLSLAWFIFTVGVFLVLFILFAPVFPATIEPWRPQSQTLWQHLHERYDPNRNYIREAREKAGRAN